MPSRTNKETQPLTRRGPRQHGFLHTDPGGNPKVKKFTTGDEVILGDGSSGPVPLPALPAHAPTHSEGGSDEVDITDLGGYSGDPSDVLRGNAVWSPASAPGAHATTHYDGGSDPVDILQLDNYTGDVDDVLRGDGTWAPVTGGAGGMVCSPLTDGDLEQPELIFALGDCIMVCTP